MIETPFFYSNLFIGLATIFTGLIVIGVFYLQKWQERMRAARVILMEVRAAESAISNIRNTGAISEITSILPQNSWFKFNHLFARALDRDEMDVVTRFYTFAGLAELTLRRINNYLPSQIEEKGNSIQRKLVDIASEVDNTGEYSTRFRKFQEIIQRENYWFSPDDPKVKLMNYLRGVDFVSTSSAGQKLKKFSGIGFKS